MCGKGVPAVWLSLWVELAGQLATQLAAICPAALVCPLHMAPAAHHSLPDLIGPPPALLRSSAASASRQIQAAPDQLRPALAGVKFPLLEGPVE